MTENPTLSRVLFIYWVFFGYVLFIVYLLAEWKSKKSCFLTPGGMKNGQLKILILRTLEAFSHVSESSKQALYNIYRLDFELFGYNAEKYFLWHGKYFKWFGRNPLTRVLVWITTSTASQHQEEWILRSKNETREDKFKIVPMHLNACSFDILYKCMKLQRRS